jgi:ABC-type glycerol-3-phosphate transport system substrate-binding protein
MSRRITVFALLFCLLLAVACSGKNPLTGSGTVTYRVTGSTSRADVTYANSSDGTSQQSNVTVPWSYPRASESGDFLYISAQNAESSGCVQVEIISGDDVLESSQSCGAFVIATASTTY